MQGQRLRRPGDSLSRIAQRELDDGNRWQELFRANKEVIEDPDMIYRARRSRFRVNRGDG